MKLICRKQCKYHNDYDKMINILFQWSFQDYSSVKSLDLLGDIDFSLSGRIVESKVKMVMMTRLLLLLVSAAGLVTSDLLSTLIMCGGDLFNCDLDHLSTSGLDPVKLFLLSQAASFQNYDDQYYQQQDDHPHYHQYQYPHQQQYQYTPDASTSLYLDYQNSQYPQNQYYQYYGQQYQYDHHHGHYDSYYQGSQYYNPALSTRSHSSPDYSQYYGSSYSFDPSYSNTYSHLGHSTQFSPNVPADLPRPQGATLKVNSLSECRPP